MSQNTAVSTTSHGYMVGLTAAQALPHLCAEGSSCCSGVCCSLVLCARCDQVRDYLIALESHLAEAHRQAARLTVKEVELGEATLEFGQVRQSPHTSIDGDSPLLLCGIMHRCLRCDA